MHYNLKVEMERINSNVVTQIEVSGVGRAGRKRIVSKDFATALVDMRAAHDELLANLEAYRNPVAAEPAPVAEAAAPAAAAPAVADAPKKQGGKPGKEAPRKFASE